MLGRLGFFLAGVVAALLLDPKSGGKRRADLARRLAPLRQRLMAAQRGDAEGAGVPAPVAQMGQNVANIASRARDQVVAAAQQAQDQIGTPSELADTARAAAARATQIVQERTPDAVKQAAQQVQEQAPSVAGQVAQRAKEQAQQVQEQAPAAVQQTAQMVHERAQQVAQQAAGAAPEQAAGRDGESQQAGESGQRRQGSRAEQRSQSGQQSQRGRSERSAQPAQANAAPVSPEDVAPTGQSDPIPEGDPDAAHPGEIINDPTLVARIESELYRDDAIPKGKLNIDAVHGVVTIRGTVEGEIADEILLRIYSVEGVSEVVDLLQRD